MAETETETGTETETAREASFSSSPFRRPYSLLKPHFQCPILLSQSRHPSGRYPCLPLAHLAHHSSVDPSTSPPHLLPVHTSPPQVLAQMEAAEGGGKEDTA